MLFSFHKMRYWRGVTWIICTIEIYSCQVLICIRELLQASFDYSLESLALKALQSVPPKPFNLALLFFFFFRNIYQISKQKKSVFWSCHTWMRNGWKRSEFLWDLDNGYCKRPRCASDKKTSAFTLYEICTKYSEQTWIMAAESRLRVMDKVEVLSHACCPTEWVRNSWMGHDGWLGWSSMDLACVS